MAIKISNCSEKKRRENYSVICGCSKDVIHPTNRFSPMTWWIHQTPSCLPLCTLPACSLCVTTVSCNREAERIPLEVCAFCNISAACLLRNLSTSPSAFRLCFRAQHSRTAGVLRLRHFVVISESRATAASENLWSVDFRFCSARINVLLLKFGEIWSGASTECVILKLTGCFNAACPARSLPCWGDVLCFSIRQKKKLCISATEAPDCRSCDGVIRNAAESVEAHTLSWNESASLPCRSREGPHTDLVEFRSKLTNQKVVLSWVLAYLVNNFQISIWYLRRVK